MTNEIGSDLEQLIRERAFQIWIEEGQPEGRDKEHWCQATNELLSGTAPPLQPNLVDSGEGQSPADEPAIRGNNPHEVAR
jgi:hypothetical protein